MSARFADLSGRVALLTGAGRGIGAGIAEAFAEAGADLAVNARSATFVVALAGRIAAATGRRVIPVVGDATTPEGVAGVVEEVAEAFGRLDILVNGVGDAVAGPLAALPGDDRAAVALPDIGRILDLNLVSALLVSRAAAPFLAASPAACVINIAAAAALRGGADMAVYSAAKAGTVGLTRALALEWAPAGIRVNAIAPGIVPDPERPQLGDPETVDRLLATIPAGRFGTPREVGDLARFLASDQARYLNGQVIYLDGGLTL